MKPHQYIELACKLSKTTPRQVIEKLNYSENTNVRALIVYLLTHYDRMHPVLIGEILNRPVKDVREILHRITSIDRSYEMLTPENVKLFDMIDASKIILEQTNHN